MINRGVMSIENVCGNFEIKIQSLIPLEMYNETYENDSKFKLDGRIDGFWVRQEQAHMLL